MTAGVVLALLQLAFALTWVTYAIHLPALAAQAGIAKTDVPWILLADQAIFVVSDLLAGLYADRLAARIDRLGLVLAGVTLGSAIAFVAMPLVAPVGAGALLVVIVLWSITSSALRAPPLVLLGRHASKPQRGWLAGAYTLGMGLAGVVGPYASGKLVAIDPRIVFAASSITLVAGTIVIVALARRGALTAAPATAVAPEPATRPLVVFAIAIALLAIGSQVLEKINATPAYLQFAKPDELGDLLPIFWIGFSAMALPTTLLANRLGAVRTLAIGAALGLGGAALVVGAGSVGALAGAQLLAGAGWGVMLACAFTAAGTAGRIVGLVASLLAVATLARIGVVASGTAKTADVASALPYVPIVAWGAGALVVTILALRRPR